MRAGFPEQRVRMSQTEIHVAVVDDDASFARALGRRLRAEGYIPSLFSSAEAFLQEVLPGPYDCLVVDIQLGGMSGIGLCRSLAARGLTIPVIFATAHDEPAIREQARQAGGRAYLRKPVPGKFLAEAINQAVHPEAQPAHPISNPHQPE